MIRPARTAATWLLAALFALAIWVGEGWHLVPGNGHLVRLPGGWLRFGERLAASAGCAHEPSWGGIPSRAPTREADEATCPICRLLGQSSAAPHAVHHAPVDLWIKAAPLLVESAPHEAPVRSFDARAPPRV